jgi:glycosyltransferase involved in cell wall biosynthesis
MMKKIAKPSIGIITYPFNKNSKLDISLPNLIEIFMPLSSDIFVITGNFLLNSNKRIHVIRIKGDEKQEWILIRALKYIQANLRVTVQLLKILKNVDIVVFNKGAQGYLVPMLISKLMRKKIIVFSYRYGSSPKIANKIYSERLFRFSELFSSNVADFLTKVASSLANQIIIESENLINRKWMHRYRDKIYIYKAPYTDIKFFKIKKNLEKRRDLVGYIGRFSKEKGVVNFAKAIPLILKRNDVGVLMGGSGPLLDVIKEELKANKSYNKVMLAGWIAHNGLPDHFNELKLLVLPSYIEGLPEVVLEAMACGTPVLATPVGGVPDLIKDRETGFIMEDNSPECIAENVVRALEYPNLDKIAKNARKLIEDEYSYEAAVEKYRKILESI